MEEINVLKDQLIEYYRDFIQVLPRLALGLACVVLFSIILRFLRKKSINLMLRRAKDKLIIYFFDEVIKAVNIGLVILFFLYVIGLRGIAGSVLAAAGISTFVIGFAFKDIGENFLAGIIMAFKRPFRVGDTVEVGGITGVILEMNIRDTQIKTFDGKDVFIPNGQILKNPFYNYTIDGFLRKEFTVGLDYGADIERARKIIQEVMEQVPGVVQEEHKPLNMVAELGSSTINITILFWLNTFDPKFSAAEVQSQAIVQVYKALTEAGINLPGEIVELKSYDNSFVVNR